MFDFLSELTKWQKVTYDNYLYEIRVYKQIISPYTFVYLKKGMVLRHRENSLPAYTGQNGISWWVDGKRSRTNGPAIIYPDCTIKWFIDHNDISKEVTEWIKENNYSEWTDENSWDDMIKLHFKLRFANE